MATTFEDNLKCAICLDFLNEPKVLTCKNGTHVFCKDCLIPLVEDNTITCPECREKHPLPKGDVEKLSTDLRTKATIESNLCADCRTFDKFCKSCDKCGVRSCHVCICGHDDGEKCELLGKMRKVCGKLPTGPQRETLDQFEANWNTFREKNAELRNEFERRLTKLIESLQKKKTDTLKTFDDYDEYARERIDWIRQSKHINESILEIRKKIHNMSSNSVKQAFGSVEKHEHIISKMNNVLSEVIPDALGTFYDAGLGSEINLFSNHITRREAGKDSEVELLFSTGGAVYQDDDKGWPTKQLAEGIIQVQRHKGGRHQLRVIDKNDGREVLATFEWNNRNPDGQSCTMTTGTYCHIPWSITKGGRKVWYTAKMNDDSDTCVFEKVMDHAL